MVTINEDDFVTSRRGKWSVERVPHRGWTCVDIEDLGEPSIQCEMCESQTIRYVHYMKHPGYPDVLQVGCVCSGHMEEDFAASRARETSMKCRAKKRKRWISRAWKISANNNPYIKADNYRVTVYSRCGGGWVFTLASIDNQNVHHCRRNYKTVDEAKLAAFDNITKLLS